MPAGLRLAPVLILALGLPSFADEPSGPSREEFLVIPIRLHVLTAPRVPDVDCHLTDADLRRVLGKVNGIWRRAGIYWGLEALVREPAANQEGYKEAVEVDEPSALRKLAPEGSRSVEGADVYYIHKFSYNGMYLGDRMSFVQELADLRRVPGGLDEPLPRVTAHELGHLLGLGHRQDVTNLLASGNNGTTLDDPEVARARRKAGSIPGALTLPELRLKADAALARGEELEARKLLTWLAEIPGEGLDDARKKLEALEKGEGKPPSK